MDAQIYNTLPFHRFVCLIAEDPNYATTACVTLYFIGRNSNPPSVSYDAENVVVFVEGQSEAVRIVVGDISVQDDDHPTRYDQNQLHIIGMHIIAIVYLSVYKIC